MHKSLLNIISAAIEFIEENIKKDISLEDISLYSNISKFYLSRIFKLLTNKSVMEYVRSRKLSCSAYELLSTPSKIVDIALEYNFDFEQSFIRSFKREFLVSPHKFRKHKYPIKLTNKLDLSFLQDIGNSILFKSEIILKPSFYIVGSRHYINIEENNQTFLLTKLANDFYYQDRQKIKNSTRPDVYLGLIQSIPEDTKSCYYTTSVEVEDLNGIPAGMTGYTIPTHKYVVFRYIGLHHPSRTTIKDLSTIYEAIFTWIHQSSYYIADNLRFERVDMNLAKDDYCEVELLVPIRE